MALKRIEKIYALFLRKETKISNNSTALCGSCGTPWLNYSRGYFVICYGVFKNKNDSVDMEKKGFEILETKVDISKRGFSKTREKEEGILWKKWIGKRN